MAKTTMADAIAAQFGADGNRMHDRDGHHIMGELVRAGARWIHGPRESRYVLPDGSCIIVSESRWRVGTTQESSHTLQPPSPRYAILRAEHDGDVTYVAWDGAEASAPIYVLRDGVWIATPHQTASARHREREAVRLALGLDHGDPAMDDIEYEYVDETE